MINKEERLFSSEKSRKTCILLIVDRKMDPITPLLNQWTYQAMIHELIGMEDFGTTIRLQKKSNTSSSSESPKIVLDNFDAFFEENKFSDWGKLGENIKPYVEEYKRKFGHDQKLDSLSDMKRILEKLSDFKKLSQSVKNHLEVLSELSGIIEKELLYEVSKIEQDLVCSEDDTKIIKVRFNYRLACILLYLK
jgi:vacuolar protein sorting-associated protein 45